MDKPPGSLVLFDCRPAKLTSRWLDYTSVQQTNIRLQGWVDVSPIASNLIAFDKGFPISCALAHIFHFPMQIDWQMYHFTKGFCWQCPLGIQNLTKSDLKSLNVIFPRKNTSEPGPTRGLLTIGKINSLLIYLKSNDF